MRVASDRKKKLPCVTTCSPGFRPSRTLTASPTGGPTFTGRSMKRPSPSAVGTYTTVRSPTDCTAPRGTTVTRPSDPLVKLTVTYMPSFNSPPRFGTSTRTLAVRAAGSTRGSMYVTRASEILLVEIADDPHRAEVRHGKQFLCRAHHLPGIHTACDDDPVGRGGHADFSYDVRGVGQPSHLL